MTAILKSFKNLLHFRVYVDENLSLYRLNKCFFVLRIHKGATVILVSLASPVPLHQLQIVNLTLGIPSLQNHHSSRQDLDMFQDILRNQILLLFLEVRNIYYFGQILFP